MIWRAQDIWQTRIQCVGGVLTAKAEHGAEVYFTATFAQVSTAPLRVAVNPNRLYPIEGAIRHAGRFAINVMPADSREQMIELTRIRRREPHKAQILNLPIAEDRSGIPFLTNALRSVFCEVESIHDTGDHTLIIARVLESRANADYAGACPLLYSEVAGEPSRFPRLRSATRRVLAVTGLLDWLRNRRGRSDTANLALHTYEVGGLTDAEMRQVLKSGTVDTSRKIFPPSPAAIMRTPIGVCVVGTHWGSFHARLVRKVNPSARLFVCGQNPERTARLAGAVRAEDFFLGMEKAIADPRVQCLILAVPHPLHRAAAEMAAEAGKHVLVEKPIAGSLADADAMIATARAAGTILMVAEDMHFRPTLGEAVRRIARGDVGEPLYLLGHAGGVMRLRSSPEAARTEEMGVLLDIGVHYVHALRLVLGEPTSVLASRAMQINTRVPGEDTVQLIFSSQAGWEAHLLLSWSSIRGNLPDLVVLGEKGTLHVWPGAAYLDYYPVRPRYLTQLVSYVRPYWLQERLMRPTLQRIRIRPRGAEATGYPAELKEFFAALNEQRPPALRPEDARRDLEIVLCAYESLRTAARAEIPPYRE